MEDLARGECEVCRTGAPQITKEQINELGYLLCSLFAENQPFINVMKSLPNY